MKKIMTIAVLLSIMCISLFAQAPQAFNYQAVARDASGNPIINKDIIVELTVRSSSPVGTIVWQEGHISRTNEFGIFTIKVGEGASTNVGTANSFDEIVWGASEHYLGLRIDFGNGLENLGTTRLLSVPYALFAEDAGNSNAQTLSLNGNQLTISNGNTVSISVDDADADPSNEIQSLSLNGSNLSISSGNTISLPGDSDADPSNEIQSLSLNGSDLSISNGNTISLPGDADADPSNEIQSLSLNGSDLSISSGNTISLPDDNDTDSTNEIQTLILNGNDLSISDGNTITFPGDSDADSTNELQTLSIVGDSIEISNGNRVLYPSTWSKSGQNIHYLGGNVMIGSDQPYTDSTKLSIFDTTKKNIPALVYAYTRGCDNFFRTSSVISGHVEGSTGENQAITGTSNGSSSGTNKGVLGFSEGAIENYGLQGIAIGNSNADSNYGVYGISYGAASAGGFNAGVYGEAKGSTYYNRGVDGRTNGVAQHNEGVFGHSIGKGSGQNIGTYGYAQGSSFVNYGLLGEVRGSGTSSWNISLFANANNSSATNTYGIYSSVPTGKYAGFFSGDLGYTGTLVNASDAKLKTNVKKLSNSIELIKSINPVSYQYKDEIREKGVNLPEGKQYGFIANEMEEVFPEVVHSMVVPVFSDKNDIYNSKSIEKLEFKGINYIGIIPVLTGAVQEQQQIIENQQEEISSLQKKYDDLEQRFLKLEEKMSQLEK